MTTPIKQIFLVEDDLEDQFFFTEALKEIEGVVLAGIAKNGKEALIKLQELQTLPHLIFMDVNMPVMNGLECLELLVEIPHLKHIPVVILSTADLQVKTLYMLGAKAFIRKPSNVPMLKNKLEEVLHLNF